MDRTLVTALQALAFAAVACLVQAAPILAADASKDGVTVAKPWIRATPGGATTAAAYLEINVAPGAADRLISIASPAAGRAELHTHIMDGDVMRMRRIDGLALNPGATVLKPHGDHVMLFDLKAPFKAGDTVPLTLVFEKAGAIAVEARVEPVGANGPQGASGSAGATPAMSGHEHHH